MLVDHTKITGSSGGLIDSPDKKASKLTFPVGLVIVILLLASGFATYLILTGLTPIIPTNDVVLIMLGLNAVLVLAMIGVIAWQLTELWHQRKRQAAGARLHVRIISLFSIVAVLPAILLAVFASISLDRILDELFSNRTRSIIQNSINVALAYEDAHAQVIREEAKAMAKALNKAALVVHAEDVAAIAKGLNKGTLPLPNNPERFQSVLEKEAAERSLPMAYIIDGKGKVFASASKVAEEAYVSPAEQELQVALEKKVASVAPRTTNKFGTIIKLENVQDSYLYVLRFVDPKVVKYLRQTRASVKMYKQLEERRTGAQLASGIMYGIIAFTLLLTAVWLGLWFANRLVSPIRRLITAAQQISSGNLDVKLKVKPREGDLSQLSLTFNEMTTELKDQRDNLVDANMMLDNRRRFMEAVLSGVTAGVIGIDANGVITLVNRSAQDLLALPEMNLLDKPLDDVLPDFATLLKQSREQTTNKLVQSQINMVIDGVERNFAVRVTRERAGDKDYGYVVTFDDITELVSAQRTSAWADIARRIAHEIKNPLTPIQLSAERIRRKYGASITTDREIFEQCTETIIRQVGDIGRMVDEFSSFARMPKPVMETHDIGEIVREAVFLFQVSHPEIEFKTEVPDTPVVTQCDRRMLSQAVTNLVKNASEAIIAFADSQTDEAKFKGRIVARVSTKPGSYAIEVIDNGCGLPKKHRNRLVEPYMTTREKGTGLGLAIVQKITEQHGGTLKLEDASKHNGASSGACIRMSIPFAKAKEKDPPTNKGKGGSGPKEQVEKTQDKQNLNLSQHEQGVTDGV